MERREEFCVVRKVLLTTAMLATLAGPALAPSAHSEQRQGSAQCVLYIDQTDNQHIHVRVPVCFDPKGNVIMYSLDGDMRVTNHRFKCEVDKIEGVERVDPSTYLVRTFCKGRKPERETLVFQIIDDGDGGVLRITNAENS
jgi:hypothetical protein